MTLSRSETAPDGQFVDALATELGSLLVETITPDEQDEYRLLVAEYRRALARPIRGDHPLASDMGDIIQIVSPYIYESAKVIVLYLITEIGASTKRLASDVIKMTEAAAKERISSWFKENFSHSSQSVLSNQQRAEMLVRIDKRLSALKADKQTKNSIMSEIQKLLCRK